nr:protein DCL, chloroplastic-like [Tanacetum cinerariifolium]
MEVNMENGKGSETWLDYEDQILEDTVPLVGFVRMILHSGKYESGERLSADHESMILQRLLAYHPESEKKIGSGIDCIMVGDHPDFESSRCMFIVRKTGDIEDFSYWKCIKGLIRKNRPVLANLTSFCANYG